MLQSVIEVDCLAALSRANSPDFSPAMQKHKARQTCATAVQGQRGIPQGMGDALRANLSPSLSHAPDCAGSRVRRCLARSGCPSSTEARVEDPSEISDLRAALSCLADLAPHLGRWSGAQGRRNGRRAKSVSGFQQAFCLGLRGETGARLCRLRTAVVNSLRPCIACRAKVLPRSAQLLKEVASRAPDLPVEDVSDGQ